MIVHSVCPCTDDFASIAEVVRRRYTRLQREAATTTTPAPEQKTGDADSGQAIVAELQHLIQETSRQVRRKQAPKAITPTALPDLILIDGGR